MKRNIGYINHLLVLVAAVMFASCEDWLDVRPKSEIPTDIHFERESGFKDQLTGVYTALGSTYLYGQELTFGLMSVLAQDYDLDAESDYRYAAEYNYEESGVKNRIDVIWSSTYNAIANLNVLLQYIDDDPDIFTDNNYYVYKGEALGLRAFLHLDMLRIFSPSPAANPSAMGVPYVTKYDKVITKQKTVTETLDLIIADLLEAEEILRNTDPMTDKENVEYRERWARRPYFNYYAVVGTLARAYMYKGDKENALKYANIIIDESHNESSSDFGWTHYTTMEDTQESSVNRLYSGECLFLLSINDLDDIVDKYFTSSSYHNYLTPSDEKADKIFEKTSKGYGNEYRMLKGFAYDGDRKYLWKYHQYEGGVCENVMPIIRKSECYYIAAECLKDSDPALAIELLNEVRSARKLDIFPLPETLTAEEIQEEVAKEYRKEFIAEGQTFFYYKRLNSASIEDASANAQGVYVLPMPDSEIEFGDRK